MTSTSGSESEHEVPSKKSKVPFNIPKNDLRAKYEKLKGKSLVVRFPMAIPAAEEFEEFKKSIKLMCARIVNARRLRQNSARVVFVDFVSPEEREQGLIELRKVEINGKKLHVEIPKTENKDYVERVLQLKEQKKDERKAKLKLKKAAKKKRQQAERKENGKVFTPTIIVRNIPKDTTVTDIKKLLPDSVDLMLQIPKDEQATATATITLPTPKDATLAIRRKLKIGENELKMSYAVENKVKKTDDKIGNKLKGTKRKNSRGETPTTQKKSKKLTTKPTLKGLHTEETPSNENDGNQSAESKKQTKKGFNKNFNKTGYNRNINKPGFNKSGTNAVFKRNGNKPGFNKSGANAGYKRNENKTGFNKSGANAGFKRNENKPGFNKSGKNAVFKRNGNKPGFNKSGASAGFKRNENKPGFNKSGTNAGFKRNANNPGSKKKITGFTKALNKG